MTTRRLSFCLWFVFIIALLLSPTKVLSVESMNRVLRSSVSFLDAQTAQAIDVKLMNTPGFSIDQLMELAGYSVACAAHNYKQNYARDTNNRNVLVFSGPGNNGGDGLVAARHLKHFGYSPKIVYPKAVKSQLFENLVQQCADLNIPILDQTVPIGELDAAGLIIDALFGFSFKGPSREPFSSIIQQFRTTKSPVLSVDIPSGWNVDEGDVHDTGFSPSALISLTLPKRSVHSYEGVHYIGGRFVPPSVEKEFNLRLPDYGFGPDQVITPTYS